MVYIVCMMCIVWLLHSGDKTEKWIGVSEMLVGVSSMGLIFHLFTAQPLLIIGFTGPLLVFEEGLYQVRIPA